MASRDEINRRREQILTSLWEKPRSVEELSRITGRGRRTVLDDISALRKSGNVIEIKEGAASLKEKTDVLVHSSKSVMRKIHIITLINRAGRANKEQLLKAIKDDMGDYDDRQVQKRRADGARKNLDKDLKELLKEHVIHMEGDLYTASIDTPEVIKFQDESLMSIYNMIVNNGDKAAYSPVLYCIAKKMEEALQYKLYAEPKNYVPSILIRNSRENIEEYEAMIDRVWRLPFKTKKLSIQAKNRYGQVYCKIIAVERMVYLCDSGKLYLMGEEHGSLRRCIIDFSRMIDAEATDLDNTIYDNEAIRDVCEEMLKISAGEPHEITVEFDNAEAVKEDLRRHIKTRTKGALQSKEGRLVYTDRIRGIDDMAKMIRRYGKSCKVLKDEALKDRMVQSSKKLIERYERK